MFQRLLLYGPVAYIELNLLLKVAYWQWYPQVLEYFDWVGVAWSGFIS